MTGDRQQERRLRPLVDVLAAFTAAGNYSYVDRIGNSLMPLIALEAARDALRDYSSACREDEYLEEDEETGLCVPCPKINAYELDVTLQEFMNIVQGDRKVFLDITRKIAVEALARAKIYQLPCKGKG